MLKTVTQIRSTPWAGEYEVKNNMAAGGGEERTSISEIAKSHRKYGSTSNHMKRNEVLMKHIVRPGETLQGLALKYGVTMELIKRTNKIWTNDSLYLRETLDIPIPRTSLDELCLDDGVPIKDSCDNGVVKEQLKGTDVNKDCESISDLPKKNGVTLKTSASMSSDRSECDKSDQSIADILIRIDSSIAQTKNQVEKREKHHEYADEGLYSPRRRSYQARLRQTMAQEDPHVTIKPAVMTQGRKVQSSLQRHQREQDEMFEL